MTLSFSCFDNNVSLLLPLSPDSQQIPISILFGISLYIRLYYKLYEVACLFSPWFFSQCQINWLAVHKKVPQALIFVLYACETLIQQLSIGLLSPDKVTCSVLFITQDFSFTHSPDLKIDWHERLLRSQRGYTATAAQSELNEQKFIVVMVINILLSL